MCGIAGLLSSGQTHEGHAAEVRRMLGALAHRGPDGQACVATDRMVLGSARLAIVDVAGADQPLANEARDLLVVFNGEIYNHRSLARCLRQRGHVLRTSGDGEVIAHLYEEYGTGAFDLLDGQFAIAIADRRRGRLVLARDRMGICPLFWTRTPHGLYFCSEVKGLQAAGVANQGVEPGAMLQMGYFGTVCAPLTPFAGVFQLRPAHWMALQDPRESPAPQRYWRLDFARRGEHPPIDDAQAAEGVAQRLERAVDTHVQGEFEATCFLSGGIDSAVIGALLARRCAPRPVTAFCASSDERRIDEGDAASQTAQQLGLQLHRVRIDEAAIGGAFERLVWHAETPTLSTEAAALMLLAGQVRAHSKLVLTGEGADEAFGGYLAFKQFKFLGGLAAPGLGAVRGLVRPLLQRHFGTDCLLPPEPRLALLRAHFGGLPAQAYEWEFYRSVLSPLFSSDYRALAAQDGLWQQFPFDREAVQDRSGMDRSLYVAYQVMLPNYLLGPHGDRIFAANSVEGRYPFLAREVVEYAARLPARLKIRGTREKHVLRLAAAGRWLPPSIAQRPKQRFVMPFGTPFVGPKAPPLMRHLLAPDTLSAYGYFDPTRVQAAIAALGGGRRAAGGKARRYLDHLALGLGVTFVASTQLWHHLFVAGGARAGRPSADAPLALAA